MEPRPAPPPKPAVVEALPAETAPLDAASSEISSPETVSPESAAADTVAPEPVVSAETGEIADIANDMPPASEAIAAPSATLLPEVAFSPVASDTEPAAVEAKSMEAFPEPAPSIETPAAESPQEHPAAETTPETVAEAAPAEAGAAEAAPEAVAAPEMVEVWRPGGRSEAR